MQHLFRNSNPDGRLDSRRLAEFEKKLGSPLPEPYRSFLLKHNGCEFGSEEMPVIFNGIGDERSSVGMGWTLPLPWVPPELFVIGEDAGTFALLIGLKREHLGRIYRSSDGGSEWEAGADPDDLWNNVDLVAEDFTGLLDRILAVAALEEGDEETFFAYLDEGHDINEPIFGLVPLEYALMESQVDLVRSMLARGADATKVGDIFNDVRGGKTLKAFLLYADALPDINQSIRPDCEWSLLDTVVLRDSVEAAKALLERGARPTKQTLKMGDGRSKRMRELLAPYRSSAA